jgi:ketose-bisphosphate aldolase
MSFVKSSILVNKAKEGGYAVPAFNTNGGNYDLARAALEIAEQMRSPLILQVYEPNCLYRGFDYYVNLAEFLYKDLNITVPVALHLDHGHSFESVIAAIQAGFTGVMIDASHCPLEENINLTEKVIDFAKKYDVSVEAEVGYVKGNETKKEKLVGCYEMPQKPEIKPSKTDVDEAVEFVKKTGVDMLAVSIGTTHGVYKEQTSIDYNLLKTIKEKTEIALVQHGTCGIKLEDLERLSKCGMAKVNFGEAFRFNYITYFNELSQTMEHLWHPWKIQQEVKNKTKEDMKNLILALGSQGKA